MRWMKKYPQAKWQGGTTRTKRKFLFLPRCLPLGEEYSSDIDMQWRWLEFSYVKQYCKYVKYKYGMFWYKWDTVCWGEKDG